MDTPDNFAICDEFLCASFHFLESDFGFAGPRLSIVRDIREGEWLAAYRPSATISPAPFGGVVEVVVRIDWGGYVVRIATPQRDQGCRLEEVLELRAPEKARRLASERKLRMRMALSAQFLREECTDLLRGDLALLPQLEAVRKRAEKAQVERYDPQDPIYKICRSPDQLATAAALRGERQPPNFDESDLWPCHYCGTTVFEWNSPWQPERTRMDKAHGGVRRLCKRCAQQHAPDIRRWENNEFIVDHFAMIATVPLASLVVKTSEAPPPDVVDLYRRRNPARDEILAVWRDDDRAGAIVLDRTICWSVARFPSMQLVATLAGGMQQVEFAIFSATARRLLLQWEGPRKDWPGWGLWLHVHDFRPLFPGEFRIHPPNAAGSTT